MPNVSWLDVTTALVSALDTALAVDVFDGPPNTGGSLTSFVCIGANPEDVDGVAEPDAGGFAQEYHDLGPSATKTENGSINCYLELWSGDSSFTTLRTSAFTLLDTINDTLRDNPTLSLTNVMAPELELSQTTIRQGYTSSGVRVQLRFTIRYRTIL